MRRASHFLTLGTALLMLPATSAMAMSFGRTVTATTLGQRLDFIAHVAVDADETLARECVGAEVLIGDNRVAPENVRVTLEAPARAGEQRVRVTTRTIVDEPVVTVSVTVGCRSRMSRRFVAFVDPPMLRLASAQADETLAPQRVDPQVAPLLEIVRAADSSRQRAAVPRPGRDGDAVRQTRRTERRPAPGHRFAAAPLARDGAVRSGAVANPRRSARPELAGAGPTSIARAAPRLRLDATAPFTAPARTAASAASASPATAMPKAADPIAHASLAPAAAADAASAAVALANERARFRELEAGMARLRNESQAQQKTLGALQARLRQAEEDRYANGLVYGLAAAMIFFGLLAAAFWALRPRQRRRARWFDAHASQQRRAAATGMAPASPTAKAQAPAVSQHPSQWGPSAHGILPVTAPATIGGLEVTTVLAPRSHPARMAEAGAPANGAGAVPARNGPPSMEELIDLEQQAEFYVVLGQDEAAIALLTAHVAEIGGASPLPFLQLLEIHQRRGDRPAYEALREEYHDHFDAFAPEWSADLHFGRSLEEYPQAVARLQALWPTPLHAMRTLDGLLYRRNEADESFDFPAYRELLFLYSIARELAGQVETDFGTIDLFLPLDDGAAETSSRNDGKFAVDVDVSGWPDDTQPEGLVIRRSAGRRSAG